MNRPNISPAFTVEDIHKLREWNYERRKGMTREEYWADVEKGAAHMRNEIEKARKRNSSS